ncbi:MAG: hypothetical protein O2829_08150 [Bacteroidetes bacterium]|nr:hypothetical protein [Bacteroidota bacterium]MDA1269049.1 hypothetical protein [Bacteroidota bacterium]
MTGAQYRALDFMGRVIFEGEGRLSLPILELELGGIQPGIYIFELFDAKCEL